MNIKQVCKNETAKERVSHVFSEGMSLRDYFAAKAMQSLLTGDQFGLIYELAEKAYIYADAMLVMREGV